MILTGLGSKYTTLMEFKKTALEGEHCVVINGFNPSFCLAELLSTISDHVLSLHHDGIRQSVLVCMRACFNVDDQGLGRLCSTPKSLISCDSLD